MTSPAGPGRRCASSLAGGAGRKTAGASGSGAEEGKPRHRPEPLKRWPCRLCGRAFKRERDWMFHERHCHRDASEVVVPIRRCEWEGCDKPVRFIVSGDPNLPPVKCCASHFDRFDVPIDNTWPYRVQELPA